MPEFAAVAHLLPEERVGKISAIQPISMGLSGAAVYAVTSTRGELVLRVHRPGAEASHWLQQVRVLRRAADHGVAPPIVHVDEAARAIVSERVAGAPLPAVLADPERRRPAIAGVVAQLRTLHALDPDGVEVRDPVAYVRDGYAAQRVRPGYPGWADGLEPLIASLEATLARDPRRVLSHNDLNPGNLLWDGTRAWLVDWEVAGLNHPFYDLATFAMFLQLDDAVVGKLLVQQEQRPVDDEARATFAALRRLVALLCGLTFLRLVPDLDVLPASAPTLMEFYAALRAGRLDLQEARGQGAFALALLRLGLEPPADESPRV
jgi:thiamine kinase-like enzyme